MELEEEDGLRLGNLVCIAVEEEVLRRESCDAGHAVLRHVGPDVSARGIITIIPLLFNMIALAGVLNKRAMAL